MQDVSKEKEIEAKLSAGCNELGLFLSSSKNKQLRDYLSLLVRWNKAYNLTSVRDPMEMLTRHLLDSLSVQPHLEGERILDVGTGAGLPGIMLAIMNENKQFTLLDSNGKKTRFLTQVCLELKLDNAKVVHTRVENFEAHGEFDVILTRAFASLSDMVTLTAPLVSKNTQILAMKAQLLNDELSTLPKGFVVESIKPLQVPGLNEERNLVVLVRSNG